MSIYYAKTKVHIIFSNRAQSEEDGSSCGWGFSSQSLAFGIAPALMPMLQLLQVRNDVQ